MAAIEFATLQMNAAKLRALATRHGVQLVGNGSRSDVKRQWVELINAAIRVGQTKVREVDFTEKRYYMLDELENYIAFQGYAIHPTDYSRFTYPSDYELQKPVYKFKSGKGYAKMKSGFDKVIEALRANAAATIQADRNNI